MDPVSILGITAAAVQFMDFGGRLLKALAEVMQKNPLTDPPTPMEKDKLDKDARQLVKLARAVESRMEPLKRSDSNGDRHLSPTEMAIIDESRRCIAAGLEIAGSIGKEAQNMSMWKKIVASFTQVWNERSVERMRSRLVDIRSSLMLAIVSNLW